MIDAYVLGRPMPRRSSSFTSDASLNRGGGCVKCCVGASFDGGRRVCLPTDPATSWSSLLTPATRINPSKTSLRPERAEHGFASGGLGRRSSTVVASNSAGVIWHATKRFQIS